MPTTWPPPSSEDFNRIVDIVAALPRNGTSHERREGYLRRAFTGRPFADVILADALTGDGDRRVASAEVVSYFLERHSELAKGVTTLGVFLAFVATRRTVSDGADKRLTRIWAQCILARMGLEFLSRPSRHTCRFQ